VPEPGFVSAVQKKSLSGLETVTVQTDELRRPLQNGAWPARFEELSTRFDAMINERGKGKDANNLPSVIS